MNISSRANAVLTTLYTKADRRNVDGMARYGIISSNVLGVPLTFLRSLAKSLGRDHNLAMQLWSSGVYEARLLATFIADPKELSVAQANRWARDFDNWAVCDGACIHLFRKTPYAHSIALKWSARKREFVRRAGYVMIATLAVHDKNASDTLFRKYLAVVRKGSADERTYVRKAVNWALRQIGKRNGRLREEAIQTAYTIRSMGTPAARWIAADALRELESAAVKRRLRKRNRSRAR